MEHSNFPCAFREIAAHALLPEGRCILLNFGKKCGEIHSKKCVPVTAAEQLFQTIVDQASGSGAGQLHFLPRMQTENALTKIRKRAQLILFQSGGRQTKGLAQGLFNPLGIRNGKQRRVWIIVVGVCNFFQCEKPLLIKGIGEKKAADALCSRRMITVMLNVLKICCTHRYCIIGTVIIAARLTKLFCPGK